MKHFSKKICCLILAALFFALTGCNDLQNVTSTTEAPVIEIDWDLHGVWMDPGGTVKKNRKGLDVSFSGTLPAEFEDRTIMEIEMDITWPGKTVPHLTGTQAHGGAAEYADRHEYQRIYRIMTWLYDPRTNDSTALNVALCPDEGFAVARVDGEYWVASLDPKADPVEIFDFYKEYTHIPQ